MRISTIIVGLASLLLLGSAEAHAHALLDRADPRVGSTLTAAPSEVSLFFSQNLEAAFSTAEVTDASGQRVDEGKPRIEGNVMRVQLRAIPPGAYRVEWHVLSVDTHTTEGRFSFEVRP
jgi:methionine-rich copper-binding protein CopC